MWHSALKWIYFLIPLFQIYQSLEPPTSTYGRDRHMRPLSFCKKLNSEQFLFEAFLYKMGIFAAFSGKVNCTFHLMQYTGSSCYKHSSTHRGYAYCKPSQAGPRDAIPRHAGTSECSFTLGTEPSRTDSLNFNPLMDEDCYSSRLQFWCIGTWTAIVVIFFFFCFKEWKTLIKGYGWM